MQCTCARKGLSQLNPLNSAIQTAVLPATILRGTTEQHASARPLAQMPRCRFRQAQAVAHTDRVMVAQVLPQALVLVLVLVLPSCSAGCHTCMPCLRCCPVLTQWARDAERQAVMVGLQAKRRGFSSRPVYLSSFAKDARWRRQPASDKQKDLLETLKVCGPGVQ